MKRATAMLLAICMIICQLPLPVLAVEHPGFAVGNEDLSLWSGAGSGVSYFADSADVFGGIGSDDGVSGILSVAPEAGAEADSPLTALTVSGVDALANPSGDGWSYDASAGTLTLSGAAITGDEAGYGIYAVGHLILQLAEGAENTITDAIMGIWVEGVLEIKGGSLTVTGEDAQSVGIYATDGLAIVEGANVAVDTGFHGIVCDNAVILDSSTVASRGGMIGLGAVGLLSVTNSSVTSVSEVSLTESQEIGYNGMLGALFSTTAVVISESEVTAESASFAILADGSEEAMAAVLDSTVSLRGGYGGISTIAAVNITGSDVTIELTLPLEEALLAGAGAPPNGIFVFADGGMLTLEDSSITVDSAAYAVAAVDVQINSCDMEITDCVYGIMGSNTVSMENCGSVHVNTGSEMSEYAMTTGATIPPAAIITVMGDITISGCDDIYADGYMTGIMSGNAGLSVSNSGITVNGGVYGIAAVVLFVDNSDISAHGVWPEEKIIALGGIGQAYGIFSINEPMITNCWLPNGTYIDYIDLGGYVVLDAEGRPMADAVLKAVGGGGEVGSRKLLVVSVPTALCVGEELNLEELCVLLVHEDGTYEELDSSELILSGLDTSIPGKKEVTASYDDLSVTFTVPVHEGHIQVLLDASVYPESSHNYGDNLDEIQTITWPGAFSITLTFSDETELENGYDNLHIYDGNGNEIACYTGTEAAGAVLTVPGDTVKVRLITDVSVSYYGYSFSAVTAETLIHTGTTEGTAKEATCTEPGSTAGIICDICDQNVDGMIIPPLGHEYESVVTEPTPEAYGYTTHTCVRCGDSYTDSITIYGAIAGGFCGENLIWALSEDYTLVISGQGEMYDFEWEGSPWNGYREQIHTVIVNEGVTKVGNCAFTYCTALVDISLPTSLEILGSEVFTNCTSLNSVVLPDSIIDMGSYVFSGCSGLREVTLPANITSIPYCFFLNCSSLTEVEIPESVTVIYGEAFLNCSGLTSVTIPANMDSLGGNPFAGCSSLCEILVAEENENFRSVDGVLFDRDVTELITYPAGKVGAYSVPDGVRSIGTSAFSGAIALTGVELPQGLVELDYGVFQNCRELQSVVIPDSVEIMGDALFENCFSLTDVTLPEGITRLSAALFFDCRSLETVTIPSSVTVIANTAFGFCASLRELELPEGLTQIEEYAFAECYNLERITFPESVTILKYNCFQECKNLSYVEFLGDAPEIGNDAFYNVTATVAIPDGNDTWNADVMQSYGGNLNWVVRGAVTAMELWSAPDRTFYLVGERVDLTGMEVYVEYDTGSWEILPVELLTVEADTSEAGLVVVTVSYESFSVSFGITVHEGSRTELDPSEYPESAHDYTNYMDETQTVIIEGCDTIELVFSSQTYTETCDYIYIYDGDYNEIARYSGSDAAGVKVEVPGDTVHIRMTSDGSVVYYGYSFDSITGLKLVHSLETVEGIAPTCTEPGRTEGTWCVLCQKPAGENASYILPPLGHSYTETRTPSTSEGIGHITYTCSDCGDSYAVEWDYVGEGMCGDSLSWSVEEQALFFMGSGVMQDYTDPTVDITGVAPWYQHRDLFFYLKWIGAVSNIGDYAFYDSGLTSADVPSSVTRIGKGAFMNSTKLVRATLSPGVMAIEDGAFAGCTALESIDIPVTVTEFGENLFDGCENLTICGIAGSAAEFYADAHGIPFIAMYGVDSGTYGENISWVIDNDFVLRISGKGEIQEAELSEDYPWHSYGRQIRAIIIDEGVTSIPTGCFEFYDNCLEFISIPASMEKMDTYSWPRVLNNVRTLNVADLESWLRIEFGSVLSSGIYGADQMLENGVPVRDIVIPEGVTELPRFLFTDYKGSFDSVTIPASLKTVGRDAFEIGGTIGTVYASSLEDWCQIDFNTPTANPLFLAEELVVDGKVITDLVIPETITELGDAIFSGYDQLESVVIPDSVTAIAYSAFSQCSSLKDVTLPDTLISIGDYAFCESTDLTGLELPDGVETIGFAGFYRCQSLEALELPAGLTYLGAYAFFNCNRLTEMVIPAGVRELSYYAFSYCYNLRNVYFQGDAPIFGDAFHNVTATMHYPMGNDTWTDDVMQSYGGDLTWVAYELNGEIASGICGEDLVWSLSMDGTLTISRKTEGLVALFTSGDMYDYEDGYPEWHDYENLVKSIVVEEGVSYIGSYAFYYMKNVTDVTILGETEIGEHAFYNCERLTNVSMDQVTSLAKGAFAYCTGLTSFRIPASLKQMSSLALYGCSSLTSLTVAEGNSRFYTTDSMLINSAAEELVVCLPNVEGVIQIPEGIVSVAEGAFYGCCEITEIRIPASVEYISNNVFSGSTKLERFVIHEDNTAYITDGISLMTSDGKTLLAASAAATDYTVPDGVEVIEYGAFWERKNLTSVILPEGVTILADQAFDYCSNLKTIVLPSTLKSIGYATFRFCGSLETVKLPEGLTAIGANAFLGCNGMSGTLYIPGTVTDWGMLAFTGVPVTEVIFGYGLTDLGDGTFSGCRAITAAHIPNTVTDFGEQYDAFTNCNSIIIHAHEGSPAQAYARERGFGFVAVDCVYTDSVTAPTCTEQGYTTHSCIYCGEGYRDTYTQPTGHSYHRDTCDNCGDKLVKVASGWSGDTSWMITEDGILTVYGSGVMKNYNGSGQAPWHPYRELFDHVVIEEGVTRIGNYCFYGMETMESIQIPQSVTLIGEYAFKNCTKLDNVILPEGLNTLGESAFFGCTGLTAIEIPASLWTVQPYTFKGCTALTSVTFHEGNLQKISDSAFYGTALTELTLPDCLDIVDVYAFKACEQLASITLGNGLTELREAVFYGTAIEHIAIPEGITKIGPYAFKSCVNLETIDLPASLTSVGEAAFYTCTGLKTVELPDSVTSIGDYAFRSCTALTDITFSQGLKTIGGSAFYGCTALTDLVFPDSLTTIGGYAFKTCTGLKTVTFGEGLAELGEGAFHTCTGLKKLVFPASLRRIGAYCFSGSYNLWHLTFNGDAPAIGEAAFKSMAATAYYPAGNLSWNSGVMQNYGGKITWKAN